MFIYLYLLQGFGICHFKQDTKAKAMNRYVSAYYTPNMQATKQNWKFSLYQSEMIRE